MMKYRESGMPSEDLWTSFFDPFTCAVRLGIDKNIHNLIDIGCGYGTFLFPFSKIVSGNVVGIDIDEEMIEICRNKISDEGITNIQLIQGNIAQRDTQFKIKERIGNIDYACLFNILHCEEPVRLMTLVRNILNDKGKIGITHWINEQTPRGPSQEIRPTPEQIINWASQAGLAMEKQVELPPFHYGLVFTK